jgi:biotin-dependent carboxylase-like uncharacterized protein
MNPGLRIRAAGPGVTLQDGGRYGFLRFGITAAGPMDPFAHAIANRSVGSRPHASALEISLGGVEVGAENGPISVAVAGAAFDLRLDGRKLPPAVLFCLEPGAVFSIRAGKSGMWCYLAVAGTIDLPPVMGSLATHTPSGIGGLHGRTLQAGDLLPITPAGFQVPTSEIAAPNLFRRGDCIRVIFGPQDDYFSRDQQDAFLERSWIVSERCDRMGYRLRGEPLRHCKNFNIISDGIALGSVQVPGDGFPIVLMADRQPTGGYPKIATVIGADIGALAQLRPGSRFNFTDVSISEAVEARRAEALILTHRCSLHPLVRRDFPSDFLLGVNLIGGVVDAAARD